MREFIASNARWLTVFQLPAYAPDLNPQGGIRSLVKRDIGNLAAAALAQITRAVKRKLKQIQYRPTLVDGCLAGTRSHLDSTQRRNTGVLRRLTRHFACSPHDSGGGVVVAKERPPQRLAPSGAFQVEGAEVRAELPVGPALASMPNVRVSDVRSRISVRYPSARWVNVRCRSSCLLPRAGPVSDCAISQPLSFQSWPSVSSEPTARCVSRPAAPFSRPAAP